MAIADTIGADMRDVVILGVGAAGACGKAMSGIARTLKPTRCRLHFIDNIDQRRWVDVVDRCDLEKTAWLAISCSGETTETLALLDVCLRCLKQRRVGGQRCHVLTAARDSTLARHARSCGVDVHLFDKPVSGRFAVLSPMGLVPAALAGVDLTAVARGARAVFDGPDTNRDQKGLTDRDMADRAPSRGAAFVAGWHNAGCRIHGIMPYHAGLADFAAWVRQLWAESLGKDGKGITPVHLVGSADHHSQLQLWLDGPRDRAMTIMTIDHHRHSRPCRSDAGLPAAGARRSGGALDGQLEDGAILADIMAQQADMAADLLVASGCPVRRIALFDSLPDSLADPLAEGIGALAAHFLVEVWLTAVLLDIEPFAEPAVRRLRELTKQRFAALYAPPSDDAPHHLSRHATRRTKG